MGSTNVDVEQKVLADSSATSEENVDSNISNSPEKEPELTFDTGLQTWLQVLGSFFLFFNSWLVHVLQYKDPTIANDLK